MSGLLRFAVGAALTLAGAVALTALMLTAPFNMPGALDDAIRWALSQMGRSDLANPEDMADIALAVYFAGALIVSALVVALAFTVLRRKLRGFSSLSG
jgi:hypothetical protein